MTDAKEKDGGAVNGIPRTPEAWQKRSPCDEDAGEEALFGACYAAMKRKPPCGPKLRQHGDTCYRAIAKAVREPRTVAE